VSGRLSWMRHDPPDVCTVISLIEIRLLWDDAALHGCSG
jgi:hypothetical protein